MRKWEVGKSRKLRGRGERGLNRSGAKKQGREKRNED
jgi:hypothetical protein